MIVILGVLAVTATPKFIDISSEANKSVLESMGGTILSASKLVYGKSIIQSVESQVLANIDIDSDGDNDVEVIYGYPSGDRTNGIANVVELGNDWAYGDRFDGGAFIVTRSSAVGFSGVTNNNIPITQANCYLTYTPPTRVGLLPTVTYTTNDC